MQAHDRQLSPEEQLHGALCALALGELDADEARALQARIDSDSSLAAQYAEIRSTIALVRGSLAEAPVLPAAHMERVLAAASQRSSAPSRAAWYSSPAARVAAGLVVFAGAGFVGLKLVAPTSDGQALAQREQPPSAERRRSAELRFDAQPGGKDAQVLELAKAAEAPPGAPAEPRLEAVTSAMLARPLNDEIALRERSVERTDVALRGLAYVGSTAAPAPEVAHVWAGGGVRDGIATAVQPRSSEAPAREPAGSSPFAGGGVLDNRRSLLALDVGTGQEVERLDSSPASPGLLTVHLPQQSLEARWQQIHGECVLRPGERPRDMHFRFWGDNAFVPTAEDTLSTFGADVDTASYALARRYLVEGHAPERAQVRTEEFVNAFAPDLLPPLEDTFHLALELAPTPFGESPRHWLLRVGVRGKEVAKEAREPLALTFVIDTSGSMREQSRLELVKHALRLLVSQLDARDTIAIVAYSSEARQVLAPTSAARRDLIEGALFPLSPSGSTNAEAGLRMGYSLAETMLAAGAHHRVVFLSDGVANVGQTDQDRINADVQSFRQRGIYLNTIGVGMNNHNDVFLEQLANKGDGICDYIDDAKAAEKAIVQRFTGAFVPIASDVKLQVEFDPGQVVRWRQLGYENRAIADHDFRNDAVDAGEVGAGHQVTCLYEVELASELPPGDAARALATLRVRWKAPKVAHQDPLEHDVFEREAALAYRSAAASFRAASFGFRRSALAGQLAEVLRRSTHAQRDDYGVFVAEVGALLDAGLADAGRKTDTPVMAELIELADLVRRADGLGFGRPLPQTDLERALEEYKRFQYRRAVHGSAADDAAEREPYERSVREALRRELGGSGD